MVSKKLRMVYLLLPSAFALTIILTATVVHYYCREGRLDMLNKTYRIKSSLPRYDPAQTQKMQEIIADHIAKKMKWDIADFTVSDITGQDGTGNVIFQVNRKDLMTSRIGGGSLNVVFDPKNDRVVRVRGNQ